MKIKCPICGAEYSDGTVKFCTRCLYSIDTDVYLNDLLNHPSIDELKLYNDRIKEYRALWNERNAEKKRDVSGFVEMIEVDGGTFLMGATPEQGEEAYDDEKPIHRVTLSGYLIGKYPVTQALWESVTGSNPSEFNGSNHPVEQVSWYDAVEFCNQLSELEGLDPVYKINKDVTDPNNENDSEVDDLKWLVTANFTANGYRLPTEAEWEYAARGGKNSRGYKYSGSNDLDEIGWYYENTYHPTNDVCRKRPNELGIYDMNGNVWEWCWDWKGEYSSSSQTDPRGHNSGSVRVVRGGSWGNYAEHCRVANRNYDYPGCRSFALGFRLVRTKN